VCSSDLNVIKDAARCNGFDCALVNKIINRFKFKQMVNESSTFRKERLGNTSFVTLPYIPALTKGLERIFRGLDMNVVYTPGPSLQSLLGNPTDKISSNETSGIYEINCKDCNKKYIAHTIRPILTRFTDHRAHLWFGR